MPSWQDLRRWAARQRTASATSAPARVLLHDANSDRAERLRVDEQTKGIRTPWVPVGLNWRYEDIDTTWEASEIGLFVELAKMVEAMRYGGGVTAGLMSTRTSMARLPVQFTGDPFLCALLRGQAPKYDPKGRLIAEAKRGIFRKMFPVPALIDALYTGILAGVHPAEMVDDAQLGHPVMHTRDLHYLRYDWSERVWKFKGARGDYLVEPGNGRWMLFMPESRHRPWRTGRWLPLSLAFVTLLTTVYDRARFQAKHADPLKVIEVPDDAPEPDMDRFQDFVQFWWERSPGIVLKYGAKASLVETQGRGFEVYRDQTEWAESQIKFALTGQTVTSDGRGGISDGGDLWRDIKDEIIGATGEALSEWVSEEGLAPWAFRWMSTPRHFAPLANWDTRSPTRRQAEAAAAKAAADTVVALDTMYAPRRRRVAVDEYFERQGLVIPTEELPAEPPPLPGAGADAAGGAEDELDQGDELAPDATPDDGR